MELRPKVWPFLRRKIANGGNAQITELTEQFARLDDAVRAILAMGILVKDVDKGTLDFWPSAKAACLFMLATREETIDYWHEIDAGFAGRQPLIESDFDDCDEELD